LDQTRVSVDDRYNERLRKRLRGLSKTIFSRAKWWGN